MKDDNARGDPGDEERVEEEQEEDFRWGDRMSPRRLEEAGEEVEEGLLDGVEYQVSYKCPTPRGTVGGVHSGSAHRSRGFIYLLLLIFIARLSPCRP